MCVRETGQELTGIRAYSWANNCAANSGTNGIDFKNAAQVAKLTSDAPLRTRKLAKASIVDLSQKVSVGLPSQFEPTVPTVNGSEGVIKSYILPDGKTGVVRTYTTCAMFVGRLCVLI